jgi:Sigma-70, region 4
MYYYDGLTLTEIGQVLGVTESRVCQIHTKALRQLRSKLADRPETARVNPAQTASAPGTREGTRERPGRARLQLLAS